VGEPLRCINPDALATPETYSHVVTASPGTLVFVAGQVAEDADGNLVGPGDLSVQAHKAFENVGHALAAAGARPEDVAKLTIYVPGHRPEFIPVIETARRATFGDHKPADALIGVVTLAEPGRLIEVEAFAVVSAPARSGGSGSR
jgi:enamine deaminase RidA (YjgF/YER057c/UK114 family)